MGKLVSVIIPVYNREELLVRAVSSVLAQRYKNWELIIVDDGSTDGTSRVAKEYDDGDKCRYFRQENSGVSAARNLGIKESKGEYLAFLDADDEWLPGNLLLKVEYLEAHPEIALVHSDVEHINERSKRLGYVNKGKEGDLLEDLLLWNGTCINCPSSILVRKTVVGSLGGFDPEFSTAADQDFYFRVAKENKIGNIAEAFVLYRVHENNMSANIRLMQSDHIGVYRKAARNGLFRSFWFRQKCFSNLYLILAGSWWRNGRSKAKGLGFMFRAFCSYPPHLGRILKKLF